MPNSFAVLFWPFPVSDFSNPGKSAPKKKQNHDSVSARDSKRNRGVKTMEKENVYSAENSIPGLLQNMEQGEHPGRNGSHSARMPLRGRLPETSPRQTPGFRRTVPEIPDEGPCPDGAADPADGGFCWDGGPDAAQQEMSEQTGLAPGLTREEYLRLLRAARDKGQERTYLLIKLFATTGIPVQCLDQVTAQLIRDGQGELRRHKMKIRFFCPEVLRQEMLNYMANHGVCEGPVFVTRRGNILNRSNLFRNIQILCKPAGVAAEKCNPRCLRELYRTTCIRIQRRVEKLSAQMYEELLEEEQKAIGW